MTAAPAITPRNAQQDHISKSLHQASIAVSKLHTICLNVEKIEAHCLGRPKIRISYHLKVISLGEPRSYSQGNNGIRYEMCLVDFEKCQVSWIKK